MTKFIDRKNGREDRVFPQPHELLFRLKIAFSLRTSLRSAILFLVLTNHRSRKALFTFVGGCFHPAMVEFIDAESLDIDSCIGKT